jgi:hypothetical protein
VKRVQHQRQGEQLGCESHAQNGTYPTGKTTPGRRERAAKQYEAGSSRERELKADVQQKKGLDRAHQGRRQDETGRRVRQATDRAGQANCPQHQRRPNRRRRRPDEHRVDGYRQTCKRQRPVPAEHSTAKAKHYSADYCHIESRDGQDVAGAACSQLCSQLLRDSNIAT